MACGWDIRLAVSTDYHPVKIIVWNCFFHCSFGFKRRRSVTKFYLTWGFLVLIGYCCVAHNSKAAFRLSWCGSRNAIAMRFNSTLYRWFGMLGFVVVLVWSCLYFLSVFYGYVYVFIVIYGPCCLIQIKWKKRSEMQTLRSGCSKAEPKNFAPPQTPFPGGAGRPKFNQLEMITTFTYKHSLVKIDARNFELSWKQTHKQTNPQTNTQTDRTDYNTLHR